MKYGSVCSGVEAATAAWHPLGWEPQWFSEIEKFPSAVLSHHYPQVPNHGDMTQYKDWPTNGKPIDLLVGGTPCQSFSVAGLRKGLDDPRGNLMLTYLAMAEHLRPKWLVWENVPGVLSSNGGRDFGTFLTALGQLGYGFSWRSLDAQYFNVAQRRKRVFVVGYLGDWRRAAAVLFERESLSGNPAPSREAGQKAAPTVTQGAPFSGTGKERVECEAIVAKWPAQVASTLNAAFGDKQGLEDQHINGGAPLFVFGAQNSSSQGDSVSTKVTPTLDKSKTPAVAICDPARTLLASGSDASPCYDRGPNFVAYDTTNITSPTNGSNPKIGDPVYTLGASQHPPLLTPQVRRLTPTECERLQGFPDNFTQIPWRNKAAENCPDGPRYKAMGNSMAVPVMRWIGERIQKVEEIT